MKGFSIETSEDFVDALKYIKKLMEIGDSFMVYSTPYSAKYGASAKYIIEIRLTDPGFFQKCYVDRED